MGKVKSITFYSNFLNEHQIPFCNSIFSVIGNGFRFVATTPISHERLNLGFEDVSSKYPYCLNAYANQELYAKAKQLALESDVVIIGSAPDEFISERLRQNKLTFRYSERFFKQGKWRILDPREFKSLLLNNTIHRKKNIYMLCASAYTASDCNFIYSYPQKVYKWGYFPQKKLYNLDEMFTRKNNPRPTLLWVGRFIDWKHPEVAVEIAKMLRDRQYDFTLDIIGVGPLEDKISNLVKKYELSHCVNVLGSLQPEKVREHMEMANIYLFTSDFNEGWGVVLNEAMNSGCAIVASHAIGSVPFLIKNGKNGLIYKNGDLKDLFNCTKRLMDDCNLCEKLGTEAYKTIINEWNAEIAADRIIKLSKCLLEEENVIFQYGPCSKAEIIKNNWYKGNFL